MLDLYQRLGFLKLNHSNNKACKYIFKFIILRLRNLQARIHDSV